MSSGISRSQSKAAEYESLISQNKGIKLGVVAGTKADGTKSSEVFEQHIFIKLENGRYLTQEDFDGFPPARREQVTKLAQATFDANRVSDTDLEAKQNAFIEKYEFTHVGKEGEDEKETKLKDTKLSGTHKEAYRSVRGGNVNGMTGDQNDILNCTSESDVRALKDKSFVKIYDKVKDSKPSLEHPAIYKEALKEYTQEAVAKYLFPLKDTDANKEVAASAHKKADSSVSTGSDDWLNHGADFTNPAHAKAIFQAIYEHGETHLTSQHSFSALIDKVTEAWHESQDMRIASVAVYGKHVSTTGNTPPPDPLLPATSTILAEVERSAVGGVLPPRLNQEIALLTSKLETVRNHIEKVNLISPPLNPFGSAATQYEKDLLAALKEANTQALDGRFRDVSTSDCQDIQVALNEKESELSSRLEALKKYDTQPLLQERTKLNQEILDLQGKIDERAKTWEWKQLAWKFRPETYKEQYTREKGEKEAQLKRAQEKLDAYPTITDWNTPSQKLLHVTSRLAIQKAEPGGFPSYNPSDSISAANKLAQTTAPDAFTAKELAAINAAKVPTSEISKSDEVILEKLIESLRTAGGGETENESHLFMKKVEDKVASIVVPDSMKEPECRTNKDFKPRIEHFENARKLIEYNPSDLESLSDESTLAALKEANKDPSVSSAATATEKRTALLTALADKRDAAKFAQVGIVSDTANVGTAKDDWKAAQDVADYENAIAYLKDPTQALTDKGAFAIDLVLNQYITEGNSSDPWTATAENIIQRLDKTKCALEIAKLNEDISGYNYQSKDLGEAFTWLQDPTKTLTTGAKKALQKLHVEAAPQANHSGEAKLAHYHQHIMSKMSGNPPGTFAGLSVNPVDQAKRADEWKHVETQLAGFNPTTVSPDPGVDASTSRLSGYDEHYYQGLQQKVANKENIDDPTEKLALFRIVEAVKSTSGYEALQEDKSRGAVFNELLKIRAGL